MAEKSINLNDPRYNGFEERVKIENDLLKEVRDYEIYSFYLQEQIDLGASISSPLRVDRHPSFSFFESRNGRIMWKDHAKKESGDVFEFVTKLFNLEDRMYSIEKIRRDIETGCFEEIEKKYSKPIVKEPSNLNIRSRPWKEYDLVWWKDFGITPETLIKFNVIPVSYIFVGDRIFQADLRAYAYKEFKDGRYSFKIYQPTSKTNKWMSNVDKTIHQGYRQLPPEGELMIITKSLKDVMSLHDTIGVPAIGLQTESIHVKDSVIDEYKRRFNKVVVLFDNDFNNPNNPGRASSISFSEAYNIPRIEIPDEYKCKDYSDLVKQHSQSIAGGLIINLIQKLR